MAGAHLANFEETVIPHLNAAYNLARWITRDSYDAEDLAQESYIKAFRFFDGFRGVDGRGWLLAIVRNTCLTWLRKTKGSESAQMFDERIHSMAACLDTDAERKLLETIDAGLIQKWIAELPPEYREIVVMRELEEMSYKEIADATCLPIGTIMSRLSRARKRLVTTSRDVRASRASCSKPHRPKSVHLAESSASLSREGESRHKD
jgi:RNA polymerase sigma-70 factor, ECF subfamily